MAASKTKTLSVTQLLEEFRRLYPDTAELQRMSLLECVLFSVLRENHSIESAFSALEKLANRDNFIDWNDVRVSELEEIRSYLASYTDPDHRGSAIKRFLRELFRKNYKFEVEGLSRKTWKEAREELSSYETLKNDFHLSQVQVLAFGGHAFPVDQRIALMLKRLGLADADSDIPTTRALLEKNISKAQILQAMRLFDKFVENICKTESPVCASCPFSAACPDYQARIAPPKPAKAVDPKKPDKKTSEPAKPTAVKSTNNSKPAVAVAAVKQADKKQPPEKKAEVASAVKKQPVVSEKKPAVVAPVKKPESTKPTSAATKPSAKPAAPGKNDKSTKPAPSNAAAKAPAPAKPSAVNAKPAQAVTKPVAKKPEPAKPPVKPKQPSAQAKPVASKPSAAKPEKKPAKKK